MDGRFCSFIAAIQRRVGRGLVGWCLAGWFLAGGAWAASDRPNIIFITVDTFRAERIGYDGYRHPTSPHLDSLAAEGVYFKQAFTTSGWTTPGLISLLTSLYAPTHGVDIRGRRLDPAVETLPEVLAAAGYRTPDIFFLTVLPNFSNLGLTDSYERRDALIDDGDEVLFSWLEEEAPKGGPFFLYYHYRDLHLPYNPGPPYEDMFMPAAFRPDSFWGTIGWFLAREKMDVVKSNIMLVRGVMDFAPRDRPWVDALYDGQVKLLDDRLFARLRRSLKELGLDQNTLVVVSADHGEELLDRGLIGHISTFKEGRLFDEIIRIPLIIWGPGVPAGRVVEEPVQCIDVMPTLLDMLDLPLPAAAQGRSLTGLMQGTEAWSGRPIFVESSAAGYTADPAQYAQRYRGIRTERWKLLYASPEDRHTLYDLKADPGETRDVLDRYPAVGDSLRRQLNEWVLYTQPRAPQKTPVPGPVASEAPAGPPRILFPADGDTLNYGGAAHSIQPRWTGAAGVEYGIEYVVGEGAYHLQGQITVTGPEPLYGPFQEGFWNSLVLYNPWKFRVFRLDRPQDKSAWVRFWLAPVGGEGAVASVPLIYQLPHLAGQIVQQSGRLLWGLGLGLVDLYGLAAGVSAADWSAWGLLAAIGAALAWPAVVRLGVARCRAWGVALAYIAFVYCTVPLMPQIWARLRQHTDGAVRYLGIVAVVALAAWIAWRLWRRVGRADWRPYAVWVGVMAAYGHLLHAYARFPSERLHLVEYGFVGYVLFRALVRDMAPRWAYVLALGLTVLVGFGDECIQWVLPQRFFELKDVQLNAIAAALGLVLTRLVRGPDRAGGR